MSKIDVENFFQNKGYNIDFLELADSSTVLNAATSIGVNTNDIAKTLAFIVQDQPIVIVMSGDAKVHNRKYRDYFGTKASMISLDKVQELTNHPVGGVCPFGLKKNVKIYLDESLKDLEIAYPAGGETNLAIKIPVKDIELLTHGIWINISKMPETTEV